MEALVRYSGGEGYNIKGKESLIPGYQKVGEP